MFLVVNNTDPTKITFHLFSQKTMFAKTFPLVKRNNNYAVFLEKFLLQARCSLRKIKGVAVVVGTDGFTSARLIVTFANALAFGLQVPVISILKDFTKESVLQAFEKSKPGIYAAVVYSGEARVG
jgi:tRNA A37 threonylcarbamoyladenosine modification protein TsaB